VTVLKPNSILNTHINERQDMSRIIQEYITGQERFIVEEIAIGDIYAASQIEMDKNNNVIFHKTFETRPEATAALLYRIVQWHACFIDEEQELELDQMFERIARSA